MSPTRLCTLQDASIARLPQELTDLVIDEFASDYRNEGPVLASLLYVSRLFHHAVRKNLYSEISLLYRDPFWTHPEDEDNRSRPPNMVSFSRVINSPQGEQVLRYVREVSIELTGRIQNSGDPDYPPIADPDVLSVIQKLASSKVETLSYAGSGWDCGKHSLRVSPYDCDIARALLSLRSNKHLRTLNVHWACANSALVLGDPSNDHVTTLNLWPIDFDGMCVHSWKKASDGEVFATQDMTPLPSFLTGDLGLDAPLAVHRYPPLRNLTTLRFSDTELLSFPWMACMEYAAFSHCPTQMHEFDRRIVLTDKEPMFPALDVLELHDPLGERGYFGLMILLKHTPMLRKLFIQESSYATDDHRQHGPGPLLDPTRILAFDMVPGFFDTCHKLKHLEDIGITLQTLCHTCHKHGRDAVYEARIRNLAEFLSKVVPPSGAVNVTIWVSWPSVERNYGDETAGFYLASLGDTFIVEPSEAWGQLAGVVKRLAGKSLKRFSLIFECSIERLVSEQRHGAHKRAQACAEVQERCKALGKIFRAPGVEVESRFILEEGFL